MKKIKISSIVVMIAISIVLVWASGRADIPNKGKKTNIFSFQDIGPGEESYNVIYDGLPIRYNKTFYKSDPTDSCYICNKSSSLPCDCGTPSQIYYSQINWLIAILDVLLIGVFLFILSRLFRLVGKGRSR